MDKPDVDQIEGLSPAISIDQKSVSHNPRSTVGTSTEIYDYLRLLFARVGIPHCPQCGRVVAKQTGLPVLAALKRTRCTDTQALLGRKQRLENLKGAFALTAAGRRQLATSAEGVILIDDVLTTGSTVDACATTLRRAGFKRVWVVTVMRG